MKFKFRAFYLALGTLLFMMLLFPHRMSAQRAIAGDSVIYEGVVIDAETRQPWQWCSGVVYAMNLERMKAEAFLNEKGQFRLAVSAKTAALPNLRIYVEGSCTPGGHGLVRRCIAEMPAPDRSQSGIKIVVGGGCGKCLPCI